MSYGGPLPGMFLQDAVYDGSPAPEGPAAVLPPGLSSSTPNPLHFHHSHSFFPPGLLVPSSGITPGPFPPRVPAYTRKVAQALARERDLEERGIMVYIEDAIQAVRRWTGFAEEEPEEEEDDFHDYGSETVEDVVPQRSFFQRVFEFVLRSLGVGRAPPMLPMVDEEEGFGYLAWSDSGKFQNHSVVFELIANVYHRCQLYSLSLVSRSRIVTT